jgi:hypothetical protein
VTREPVRQRWALKAQLWMIAGAEPAGSFLELRYRLASGSMGRGFFPTGDLDRMARAIVNRGQLGDTYIGCAPRTREAGTADAVQRAWCAWVDCDSPEAIERLRAFQPRPSIVVRSGRGLHAYWQLRPAISGPFVEVANKRLAHALGADIAATDRARVMRPIRSHNFKAETPRRVECLFLDPTVYTVAEVVGALPDPAVAVPRVPRPDRPVAGNTDAALDGLIRTVAEAPEGNRNASLYWAACRLRDDERTVNPRGGREALRQAALSAGLGEHEVDATLSSALDRRAAA